MTESGATLFQSSDFGVGEISPVVVHYPTRRGIVFSGSFIYYICWKTSVKVVPLLLEFVQGFCPAHHCGVRTDMSGAKVEIKTRARFHPKDTHTRRKRLLSSLFKSLSNIVFIVLGVEASLSLEHRGYDSRSLLPCNTLQSPHTETWIIHITITSGEHNRLHRTLKQASIMRRGLHMSVRGSRRSNQTSVSTARVMKTIASLSYDCLSSICDICSEAGRT